MMTFFPPYDPYDLDVKVLGRKNCSVGPKSTGTFATSVYQGEFSLSELGLPSDLIGEFGDERNQQERSANTTPTVSPMSSGAYDDSYRTDQSCDSVDGSDDDVVDHACFAKMLRELYPSVFEAKKYDSTACPPESIDDLNSRANLDAELDEAAVHLETANTKWLSDMSANLTFLRDQLERQPFSREVRFAGVLAETLAAFGEFEDNGFPSAASLSFRRGR